MPRPPSQPLLRAPRPAHPLAPLRDERAPAAVAPAPAAAPALDTDPEDVDPLFEATPEGDQVRTFTTRLPVDLRRRLRRHAINTDQTLEQVARAMVREYLERHEADGL